MKKKVQVHNRWIEFITNGSRQSSRICKEIIPKEVLLALG